MRFTAFCAIVLLAGLAGCAAPATSGAPEAATADPAPRLTASEALSLADDYVRAQPSYEPFDPAAYPDRKATLRSGSWWVFYSHVPNRHPGDHFTIEIDDATGAIRIFGGA